MLANIIPILVILLGTGTIIFILVGKFSQISNLDVANLPAEQEARKKKEIIRRRLAVERSRIGKFLASRMKPVIKLWGNLQLRFRVYVGKVEKLWHHEQRIKTRQESTPEGSAEREQKLGDIIQEAEQELKNNRLDRAEELFIAAIKIDAKSVAAYRGLADTYLAQENSDQAEETYQFLLRLSPGDDNVMVKIADIAERKGELDKAINFYQQAVVINDSLSPRFFHLAELLLKVKQPDIAKEVVQQALELEPKNPKYLDLLIETGIQCGDKDLATQAYNELRLVNPDNQKLANFHDQINRMK